MIDWPAFLVVAVASIVAAGIVVTLYSLGLRLLLGDGSTARSAGYACFAVCAAAVLFGVYLIVPALHGG